MSERSERIIGTASAAHWRDHPVGLREVVHGIMVPQ